MIAVMFVTLLCSIAYSTECSSDSKCADQQSLDVMYNSFQKLPYEERERYGLIDDTRPISNTGLASKYKAAFGMRQAELLKLSRSTVKPAEEMSKWLKLLREHTAEEAVETKDIGDAISRALFQLQDMVDDVDNVKDFHKLGGLSIVSRHLHNRLGRWQHHDGDSLEALHRHREYRGLAAWTIGTACKHDEEFQHMLHLPIKALSLPVPNSVAAEDMPPPQTTSDGELALGSMPKEEVSPTDINEEASIFELLVTSLIEEPLDSMEATAVDSPSPSTSLLNFHRQLLYALGAATRGYPPTVTNMHPWGLLTSKNNNGDSDGDGDGSNSSSSNNDSKNSKRLHDALHWFVTRWVDSTVRAVGSSGSSNSGGGGRRGDSTEKSHMSLLPLLQGGAEVNSQLRVQMLMLVRAKKVLEWVADVTEEAARVNQEETSPVLWLPYTEKWTRLAHRSAAAATDALEYLLSLQFNDVQLDSSATDLPSLSHPRSATTPHTVAIRYLRDVKSATTRLMDVLATRGEPAATATPATMEERTQ